MGIRQKGIQQGSLLGASLWSHKFDMAESAREETTSIVFAECDRIEILEFGGLREVAGTGTVLLTLTYEADALPGAGTEIFAFADIATAKTVFVKKFDPPYALNTDYANANASVTLTGFELPRGIAKLSMIAKGTSDNALVHAWCWLRPWKRDDL
jgi:hypothetical protein